MNRVVASVALSLVVLAGGCGPDETPAATSLVPTDYARRFPEVRGCRNTIEHASSYGPGTPSISNIRVVASPEAMANYRVEGRTLPAGSLVIKEEFADSSCSTVIGWTVMRKEPGYDTAHGDWHWQRVRASDRAVLEDGRVSRCISCHNRTECTSRDWMCTEP